MGGFIAGGSRDQVELRQLHVTCNVHPPGFHQALMITIVSGVLSVSYRAQDIILKKFSPDRPVK